MLSWTDELIRIYDCCILNEDKSNRPVPIYHVKENALFHTYFARFVALFTRAWIEIFQNKVLLARIRGRRIIKSSAAYSLNNKRLQQT